MANVDRGSLIGAVLGAIMPAVAAVAHNPTLPISPADAKTAGRAVEQAVRERVAADPTVQHVTNTEPWYQSRVTLGVIVAVLFQAAGLAGVQVDWVDPETAMTLIMAGGTVIGGIITLIGRWRARRPLLT